MKQFSFNSIKGNIWLEGLFGLEKENLRVDRDGKFALTPHPAIFGNKLKHPFVTTDFSESQVEMITPAFWPWKTSWLPRKFFRNMAFGHHVD